RGSSRVPRAFAVPFCSRLGTQLLGESPQLRSALGVARVGGDAFADAAVFEVQPALVGQFGAYRRPHLSGRAVFGRGEIQVAVLRFAACGAAGHGVFAQLGEIGTG